MQSSKQSFPSQQARRRIAAAVVLACASAAPAGTTLTFNPIADAFVSSSNATGNYGGGGALAAVASGTAKGEFDTVMRFDQAAINSQFDTALGAGNWTIQSASLKLSATSPSNAIFNNPNVGGQVALKWMQNDSWVEGSGSPNTAGTSGINFSTLASFLGPSDEALGSITSGNGTSGTSGTTLSLTPGFKADLAAGGTNGVSFEVLAGDSSVSYVFNSRSGAVQPVLSITADIPEPAMAGIMSAAGAAFLLKRRRQT